MENMPNFDKKILTILLLVLLILLAGLGLLVYILQDKPDYKSVLGGKEALLIIDYGRGQERWFKGEVIQGMTVRDVLETASQAGNFIFAANSHLASVDGTYSNQEKQWNCYLGNEEIEEDLNKKIIQPNDKISCRYR